MSRTNLEQRLMVVVLAIAALANVPVPTSAQQEKPAASTQISPEDRKDVAQYSVPELLKMMADAQYALSYNGRLLIRERSRLVQLADSANSVLEQFRSNATLKQSVERVRSFLASSRTELLALLKIDDDNKLNQEAEKLFKNGNIDDAAIFHFIQYEDARSAFDHAKQGIDKITKMLDQPVPVAISSDSPGGGGARNLTGRVDEIINRLNDKQQVKPAKEETTRPSDTPDKNKYRLALQKLAELSQSSR